MSNNAESDSVRFNAELYAYYKKLFALRRQHSALREGSFQTLHRDDERGVIAFRREFGKDVVFAVFNVGAREVSFNLPIEHEGHAWREVVSARNEQVRNHRLPIVIEGRSAQIWVRSE